MAPMLKRGFEWFCRDRRSGRIVIAQWPNLPLWLFGAASLASLLLAGRPAGLYADIAARLCLAWWAADELLRGVNPWRRCLGAAVLVLIVVRLAT